MRRKLFATLHLSMLIAMEWLMRRRALQLSIFLGMLFNILSVQANIPSFPSSSLSQQLMRADTILVEKQKHVMKVFQKNKLIKTYRIALGFSPVGHKFMEGDGKTPEGIYYIVGKNSQSLFHRSLKLSYPSRDDQKRAEKKGVKPGSNIMIHGLGERQSAQGKWHAMKDWTLGCIAVTNEEIEEIFKLVEVGTKIIIYP